MFDPVAIPVINIHRSRLPEWRSRENVFPLERRPAGMRTHDSEYRRPTR
jgi:hypothetical protein